MWRTSYLAVSVALPVAEGAAAHDVQALEDALPGGLSPEAAALGAALRGDAKRARAAALAPALAAVLRAIEATRLQWG